MGITVIRCNNGGGRDYRQTSRLGLHSAALTDQKERRFFVPNVKFSSFLKNKYGNT